MIQTRCCGCLRLVEIPEPPGKVEIVRKECPHCHAVLIVRVRDGRWVYTMLCGHDVPVVVPLAPPGME